MNKAYYWYIPHPYFDEFYPGQVLNSISDLGSISKYFSDPERIALAKKYFPNGLSPHGLSMLLKYQSSDSSFQEPVTEIIFELTRQLHFPTSPSRLNSLYASETINQADQWRRLWCENFNNTLGQVAQTLWEIEYKTNAQLYDANWLDYFSFEGHKEFSYLVKLENAFHYWQHDFTPTPLPELLIPYPVKVIRVIRNTDDM